MRENEIEFTYAIIDITSILLRLHEDKNIELDYIEYSNLKNICNDLKESIKCLNNRLDNSDNV